MSAWIKQLSLNELVCMFYLIISYFSYLRRDFKIDQGTLRSHNLHVTVKRPLTCQYKKSLLPGTVLLFFFLLILFLLLWISDCFTRTQLWSRFLHIRCFPSITFKMWGVWGLESQAVCHECADRTGKQDKQWCLLWLPSC